MHCYLVWPNSKIQAQDTFKYNQAHCAQRPKLRQGLASGCTSHQYTHRRGDYIDFDPFRPSANSCPARVTRLWTEWGLLKACAATSRTCNQLCVQKAPWRGDLDVFLYINMRIWREKKYMATTMSFDETIYNKIKTDIQTGTHMQGILYKLNCNLKEDLILFQAFGNSWA